MFLPIPLHHPLGFFSILQHLISDFPAGVISPIRGGLYSPQPRSGFPMNNPRLKWLPQVTDFYRGLRSASKCHPDGVALFCSKESYAAELGHPFGVLCFCQFHCTIFWGSSPYCSILSLIFQPVLSLLFVSWWIVQLTTP